MFEALSLSYGNRKFAHIETFTTHHFVWIHIVSVNTLIFAQFHFLLILKPNNTERNNHVFVDPDQCQQPYQFGPLCRGQLAYSYRASLALIHLWCRLPSLYLSIQD